MAAPVTPTTSDVRDNIVDQISAQLGQRAPILSKAFTRVMATALAGVVVTLYKYAGFMFLQLFVRTASNQPIIVNGRTVVPLQEWGTVFGVGLPRAATAAQLTVTVTVLSQGGTLASNQPVQGPNGVIYITTGSVALNAATVDVVLTAASDQQGGDGSGTIGNLSVGAQLSFVQPIANVDRTVTVTVLTTTGVNAETTEAYRARVLRRAQRRPQGGALADYQLWGESSSAVLNAYPYAGATPGTVTVYIESPTETDGIPTAGQLTQALAAINFDADGRATRAPVGALPNTQAITRETFNVTITTLTVTNPTQVQADIDEALTNYFLEREPFIVGLSTGPRRNVVTQSEAAGIVANIVSIAGGTFASLTLTDSMAATVTSRILPEGAKAKIGTVTYAA